MTAQPQPTHPSTNVEQLDPQSVAEQATEWYLRWHCGDLSAAERYEYLSWLKESSVHVAETLRMVQLYAWVRTAFERELAAERVKLNQAWDVIRSARDRDLVLWAEDSVSPVQRIQQAMGLALPVPESTLKTMAGHERQRRSKRRERLWLILGIVLTAILSPIIVANFPALITAISAR